MKRPPDFISEAMRLTRTKCPKWLVPNCVSNPSSVLPKGQAMTPALAITTSKGFPAAFNVSAQARTHLSDAGSVRKSVVYGKSGYVRVVLGGGRIIKKTKR